MSQIQLKKIKVLYILVLVVLLISCARKEYFHSGAVQEGLASWYGPDFHGKPTSSREIYNMYDMTAAHKSIPFGTYVMVTNLNNGKSIIVRINDRGPFIKGRIIDLSYAAANMLDMVGPGVAPVKIEILEMVPSQQSSQKFSVQVGSFIYKKNAENLKKRLQKKFKNVYIVAFKTSYQIYYRVRIKAQSMEAANKIARKLLNEGFRALILEGQ